MSSKQFVITNGPGKWDFVTAIFDPHKEIMFSIKEDGSRLAPLRYVVFVFKIELTDHQKTQCLIEGRLVYYSSGGAHGDGSVPFSGFYDTISRSGNLEIED